jgi:hypothetical protein
MSQKIWENLPLELAFKIVTYIPQGRFIDKKTQLKKKSIYKCLKSWVSRHNRRMINWFMKNNNPPHKIKTKLAKLVYKFGSRKTKKWFGQYAKLGYRPPMNMIIFARNYRILKMLEGSAIFQYSC